MKKNICITALAATLLLVMDACETATPPEDSVLKSVSTTDSTTAKIQETFYENGVLRTRGTSVNGAREGLWTSYYPNGFLWSESEYSNNKKNGRIITYFDNGKIRYSGIFLNDEKTGLWTFYDSTGTVVKQVDYTKN